MVRNTIFWPLHHEANGCHGNRCHKVLSLTIPDPPAEFGHDRSINDGVDSKRTNGRTNPNYSMMITPLMYSCMSRWKDFQQHVSQNAFIRNQSPPCDIIVSFFLQTCRETLKESNISDQVAADCLCSILLLEDSTPRQVFNELLVIRTVSL